MSGAATRWMSCARNVDWHTSRHRHLVRVSTSRWDRGWADTLCGASGTPGSFRTNRTKAPCPACCAVAGIAVPSSGHTERGSTMPTTMKNPKVQPRKKGKQVQRVNAARPVLTPEDVKASARAYADRVHRSAPKKGLTPRPWIVLYIERWRHLSGLKRNVPGPVGEYRHAGPVA